jgi:hypothetical protein
MGPTRRSSAAERRCSTSWTQTSARASRTRPSLRPIRAARSRNLDGLGQRRLGGAAIGVIHRELAALPQHAGGEPI